MAQSLPLVVVRRGGHVESVHRGALAIVEEARPLLVYGDLGLPVFYRSTSKPIQALVGITSGAADALGLTDEELALAAGSHNAEPDHLRVARSILTKAGLGDSALGCGGHYSIDPDIAHEQRMETREPPAIWSNCSGKHALMLATAVHLGAPAAGYLDPEHPVQREIRRHVATLAGVPYDAVGVGIDNCGAPAFAVPLLPMARSLGRLVRPEGLSADLAAACRRVVRAMLANPNMVGGRKRFDTELMAAAPGVLIAKAGAEGVHGWAAVDRAVALAIKVEDGRDRGYRLPVVAALEALGVLEAAAAQGLRDRQCEVVTRNWRRREVGGLEVAPDLAAALAGL